MKNHHLPYAQRLRGVATAAALACPNDAKAKSLKTTAVALEATVRVGANRSTLQLIDRARRDVSAIQSFAEPELVDAFRDDAREALNRLAGMVRRNDPDPEYVG